MEKDIAYDRACDMWNDFVQDVFREWCRENGYQPRDDEAWEEWLESDTNAGLIKFLKHNR